MRSLRLAGALAGALASAAVFAQAPPPRWYLQVDNDVVFHTDRWYSSGVRIARVAEVDGHEIEFGVVQEVYMPEQKHWRPGRADRAPTARLLLDAARHTRREDRFDTLEMQAGVRGEAALGEGTTRLVHDVIPGGAIVDWSRQLPNRFDGSLIAARSMNAGPLRAHFGGQVGTQVTFAHTGAELRFGAGSRDIDFQVMRFAATPPFAHRKAALGWGAFAGASVRLVAHDGMIGPNYDLPCSRCSGGADIHLQRAIGRLAAGAAWTFEDGVVTFSLVHDTREFEEQRKPQQFGSLAVHWAF